MQTGRLWIAGGLAAAIAAVAGGAALLLPLAGSRTPTPSADARLAEATPAPAPVATSPPAQTAVASAQADSQPARPSAPAAPAQAGTPAPVTAEAAQPAPERAPAAINPPPAPAETQAVQPPVRPAAPEAQAAQPPPTPVPAPVAPPPAAAETHAAQPPVPAIQEQPPPPAAPVEVQPPPAPAASEQAGPPVPAEAPAVSPAPEQAVTPPLSMPAMAPTTQPPTRPTLPAPAAAASPAPESRARPSAAPEEAKAAPAQAKPAPPEETALAALRPAALRRIIGQAIAPLGCALLAGEVDSQGHVRIAGVVARDEDPILHRMLLDSAPTTPVAWEVTPLSGPYCRVLDALRPAAAPFGEADATLGLTLRSGTQRLTKDMFIIPVVRTPDFPSVLTLDYFASDGSVAHLSFATPAGKLPARRSFSVGDPHPADPIATLAAIGAPGWQVDVPYGVDLIAGIASERPLFTAPRPEGESPEAYVSALRAALEAATRRGERLAVAAVAVETAER